MVTDIFDVCYNKQKAEGEIYEYSKNADYAKKRR